MPVWQDSLCLVWRCRPLTSEQEKVRQDCTVKRYETVVAEFQQSTSVERNDEVRAALQAGLHLRRALPGQEEGEEEQVREGRGPETGPPR